MFVHVHCAYVCVQAQRRAASAHPVASRPSLVTGQPPMWAVGVLLLSMLERCTTPTGHVPGLCLARVAGGSRLAGMSPCTHNVQSPNTHRPPGLQSHPDARLHVANGDPKSERTEDREPTRRGKPHLSVKVTLNALRLPGVHRELITVVCPGRAYEVHEV